MRFYSTRTEKLNLSLVVAGSAGVPLFPVSPTMSSLSFLEIASLTVQCSPYKPGARLTIALDDADLSAVDEAQYERFWRVWWYERATYAPILSDLTLVLRASGTPYKGYSMEGIKKFLAAIEDRPVRSGDRLRVYLDNYTSPDAYGNIYELHTEPECIYDSAEPQSPPQRSGRAPLDSKSVIAASMA